MADHENKLSLLLDPIFYKKQRRKARPLRSIEPNDMSDDDDDTRVLSTALIFLSESRDNPRVELCVTQDFVHFREVLYWIYRI
ncbi:hypothetical protein CEXT_27561, partial [Caerostris extrusa]